MILYSATDAPIASRESISADAANRWVAQVVRGTDWPAMTRCNLVARTSYERQSRALAIATAAVESHVRPAWVRDLKSGMAHARLVVFGTLPDFSLGIAQIKPSTAAAWMTSPTSGTTPPTPGQLWSVLNDDCPSLGLVYGYYMARSTEDPREKVAVFNGQAPQRARDRTNLYIAVVMAVADRVRLLADGSAETKADQPIAPVLAAHSEGCRTATTPCSLDERDSR
jgi:hypothetical protein